MGLELGTFIDDLIQTNPLGSDDKRQGDDHLRLLKKVLQNTIKRASKAFYVPSSIAKNANYTVLDTDENMTIQCNTAAAFTLTLPNLDTTRSGWTINIVKASTDMNPVFLVPVAGVINGFTKVRRSVAATITQVVWTGTAWVASRPHGAPVGTVLEYYGNNLPQGHLWANGAAIDGANFVEALAVLGANVPDKRGRAAFGRDDMGGAAAGRITAGQSGISGVTLLGVGGVESLGLSTSQLPAHLHQTLTQHYGGNMSIGTESADHSHGWGGRFYSAANSTTGYNLDHYHSYKDQRFVPGATAIGQPGGAQGGGTGEDNRNTDFTSTTGIGTLDHAHYTDVGGSTGGRSAAHDHGISGSTQNTGAGATHSNMPPTIICNAIVVAE